MLTIKTYYSFYNLDPSIPSVYFFYFFIIWFVFLFDFFFFLLRFIFLIWRFVFSLILLKLILLFYFDIVIKNIIQYLQVLYDDTKTHVYKNTFKVRTAMINGRQYWYSTMTLKFSHGFILWRNFIVTVAH